MFTVGDVLKHKNERLLSKRLSQIRREDPASLFGSGFVHYEDTNGRDQWTFEHEAGLTFDISGRTDPASFDLVVWLYDGGHVIADYSGVSVMAIVQVITANIDKWIPLANEATRPREVDMSGIDIDPEDYDQWKHEHELTARYQDQQYLERVEREAQREAQRTQEDGR